MGKKQTVLMPQILTILEKMGSQIQMARLRRKLSATEVSQRAGISRATLWQIENGSPSVAIGSYASVLMALRLENDLLLIAKDDLLGRTYQDLNLPLRKKQRKEKTKISTNAADDIIEFIDNYEPSK